MVFWFFRKKQEDNNAERLSTKLRSAFLDVKTDMQRVVEWISVLNINDEKSEKRLSEIEKNLENMNLRMLRIEEDEHKVAVWTADQTAVQTAVQNWTAVRPKQTVVQKKGGDLEKYFKGITLREGDILRVLLNTDREINYNELCEISGRDQSTLRGQINKIKIKYPGAVEEIVDNRGKKSFWMNKGLKEKIEGYLNKKKNAKKEKMRVRINGI